MAEVRAASGRFLIDQTAAEMRAVRSNDERKEEEMAFSCVLYLKEECDGCGICQAQKQTDNEET